MAPVTTAQLIEATKAHRLFAAFHLAMNTGLRRGEVLGLRWKDIEGDTLHIKRSLVALGNGCTLRKLITRRGVRRVVIVPETFAVLESRRAQQFKEKRMAGEGWRTAAPEYADLIFTTEQGEPIHPKCFSQIWYGLLKAAKVTTIRLHDLRHIQVSSLSRQASLREA